MERRKYRVQVNVIVHEVFEVVANNEREAKSIASMMSEDHNDPLETSEKILGANILEGA